MATELNEPDASGRIEAAWWNARTLLDHSRRSQGQLNLPYPISSLAWGPFGSIAGGFTFQSFAIQQWSSPYRILSPAGDRASNLSRRVRADPQYFDPQHCELAIEWLYAVARRLAAWYVRAVCPQDPFVVKITHELLTLPKN